MQLTFKRSTWQKIVFAWFGGVVAFNLYHAYWLLTFPEAERKWLIGDWLINYQGGFVRRGLLGDLFFRISQATGVHIILLVVVFQVVVYLLFFLCTYRLARSSSFSISTAFLLFSPAFILFTVLSPNGAFRKEVLLLAALSALCYFLTVHQRGGQPRTSLLLSYVAISSVFLVLNHEMLTLFLPYLIAAIIIHEKGWGDLSKKATLALLPAVLITLLVFLFFKGDGHTVNAVCASLKDHAPEDCLSTEITGAVTFLKADLTFARHFVEDSFVATTALAYGLSAIFSVIPFVLVYFSSGFAAVRQNKTLLKSLTLCVISALILTVPLLWVMADYGRLIYLHVSCLTLLALMLIQEPDGPVQALPLQAKQLLGWIAAILYMCGWRLIYWQATLEQFSPLVGMIGKFFNIRG